MKTLVTGANGFVGGWLVRRLLHDGHEVIGAAGPETGSGGVLDEDERRRVTWLRLDLDAPESVGEVARAGADADAVVHLAAASSVAASVADPTPTWRVNTVGTVALLEALAAGRPGRAATPTVLLVSTGEVYGPGPVRPRTEDDPIRPVSPYAASKAGAEIAALEISRRTGLRVVVARPFPHTGPGQSTRFVVPAFVERLRIAARARAPVVKTGNLEPVRDLLDVRDVVEAYIGLITRGIPGEVYNVASGDGISLGALFDRIGRLLGHRAIPEPDPGLARAVDIPHLVGDAARLRAATGWTPHHALDQTLQLMIDAQAD